VLFRVAVISILCVLWTTVSWAQQPRFSDFPADVYTGRNAPVRLTTEMDRAYRTRLREGATQRVDFAGHYTIAVWGCGTDCLSGAAIDVQTGVPVWLPGTVCCIPPELSDRFEKIASRPNSRLLVVSGLINEAGEPMTHYYLMDNGRLVHLSDGPLTRY
jgi:hypothetical protein